MARLLFRIALFSLLTSSYAFAATILIATDQPGSTKAKEVKRLVASTPPFSLFKSLNIKIVSINSTQLSCTSIQGIARLVKCDSEKVRELAGKANADRTIVVKNSQAWEGGGDLGGDSVVTVGSQMPTPTAIHELLHSFGFNDEYEYSKDEATIYCRPELAGPNIVMLPDLSPYPSDAVARNRHGSSIPWFKKIRPDTPIVSGPNLGTPIPERIGLYKAKVCDNSAKLTKAKIEVWKPGNERTVMEDPTTNYIPRAYWDTITQGLSAEIDYDKMAATLKPQVQVIEKGAH